MVQYNNITDLGDFFTVSNTLSGGFLYISLVTTVFAVLFFSSMGWGRSRSLVFTSFVTLLMLVILNSNGMVDYFLILIDCVLLGIGLFRVTKGED